MPMPRWLAVPARPETTHSWPPLKLPHPLPLRQLHLAVAPSTRRSSRPPRLVDRHCAAAAALAIRRVKEDHANKMRARALAKSMKIRENRWKSKKINEKSTKIKEHRWKINGNQRKHTKFNENRRKSMRIRWKSRKIVEKHIKIDEHQSRSMKIMENQSQIDEHARKLIEKQWTSEKICEHRKRKNLST